MAHGLHFVECDSNPCKTGEEVEAAERARPATPGTVADAVRELELNGRALVAVLTGNEERVQVLAGLSTIAWRWQRQGGSARAW